MKKLLTTAVLSALGFMGGSGGFVMAAQYGDVGTVISATPIYERISTPRRECRNEQVAAYEERRVVRPVEDRYSEPSSGIGAGTVLGAILGGVIGHQFGNSSGGRDHGAAAGAVIGGLVGNQAERENESGYRRSSVVEVDRVPVTRDVQRCRTVADYREELAGYDVRYSYNGREYTARLSYDPGPTIPLDVGVRPAERSRSQPVPSYRPQ